MKITEIFFKDWRNIAEMTIYPESAVNIFLGRNAQGKTNILEAINFASLLRSRAGRESELIRWGQSAALVRIKFVKADISHTLAIEIPYDNRRRILLDANPIRPRELIGKLNSVLFSPEDLFMFKGPPAGRRKFLDAQISQAVPIYFMDLMRYTRIVEQRNALLKKIRDGQARESDLDFWDEQFSYFAAKVVSRRLTAVDKLSQLANDMHREISSRAENLSINYETRIFDSPTDNAAAFFRVLRERRSREIQKGSTGVGPHRDDLKFYIDEHELKIFGSQGQLRTAELALKLSELKFIKNETGEYPLLLLDDVMSELDASRREKLLEFLRDEQIQTLITATDRAYFPQQSFGKIFSVESGRLDE